MNKQEQQLKQYLHELVELYRSAMKEEKFIISLGDAGDIQVTMDINYLDDGIFWDYGLDLDSEVKFNIKDPILSEIIKNSLEYHTFTEFLTKTIDKNYGVIKKIRKSQKAAEKLETKIRKLYLKIFHSSTNPCDELYEAVSLGDSADETTEEIIDRVVQGSAGVTYWSLDEKRWTPFWEELKIGEFKVGSSFTVYRKENGKIREIKYSLVEQ